ncbi:threonine/serine dehydratase [bacterium]|nr:threonine/serine dehydratase [bacterium]
MAQVTTATIDDVLRAASIVHRYVTPVPLFRSYALEKRLGLPPHRQVWIKDYGWTPVGSFKVMGALAWMDRHAQEIGTRPVAAHSSGNFACGISFAGMKYQKKVIIVMPESAPRVKFEMTKSFGAEIRTYDITNDHLTGIRDKMTRAIVEDEGALQASPYDDNDVIAGNGVGGFEITSDLKRMERSLSHFLCPVSGGGLMAGHALAIADAFPDARIIGVEPDTADDFRQSLAANERVRLDHPSGICDGLLSYDVGLHNWPILKQWVKESVAVPDLETKRAMAYLYEEHGLRSEPSGAITIAAALREPARLEGNGDIVFVLSGRNIDESPFRTWIADAKI